MKSVVAVVKVWFVGYINLFKLILLNEKIYDKLMLFSEELEKRLALQEHGLEDGSSRQESSVFKKKNGGLSSTELVDYTDLGFLN